jgi:hypothetical protein
MKSYEAGATIEASPATVWAVLTDAAAYPTWSSGVERVEGTVTRGARIKVFSEVSPGRAFPVTVATLDPPGTTTAGTMTWRGGMPFGVFRGVRTFRVEPSDGGTRFSMREEFTGPLLPLIWKSMPDLGPSFRTFAEGLKARAEGIA